MSIIDNRYDEIKDLLKKSRLISEQYGPLNVAKTIEQNVEDSDEYETYREEDLSQAPDKKDKVQKYRISGGILAIHGKSQNDLELTTDDKTAFQETMDEFVDDVSDLVDFNVLNVYPNNVEWSGKVIDEDLEFILTIGENSGIYIKGDMIKVDDEFLEVVNRLQQFYQKFKAKWAKILSIRKKTPVSKM